jgi:hypothetical protein
VSQGRKREAEARQLELEQRRQVTVAALPPGSVAALAHGTVASRNRAAEVAAPGLAGAATDSACSGLAVCSPLGTRRQRFGGAPGANGCHLPEPLSHCSSCAIMGRLLAPSVRVAECRSPSSVMYGEGVAESMHTALLHRRQRVVESRCAAPATAALNAKSRCVHSTARCRALRMV